MEKPNCLIIIITLTARLNLTVLFYKTGAATAGTSRSRMLAAASAKLVYDLRSHLLKEAKKKPHLGWVGDGGGIPGERDDHRAGAGRAAGVLPL